MSQNELDELKEKIASDLGVPEEHALEIFDQGMEEGFLVFEIPESEVPEAQRNEIIANLKNAGCSPEEIIEWV